jgi:uncharacterized membrane protein (UPF0136 family)
MLSLQFIQVAILIYAILVASGGFLGFMRTGSRISVITGVIFAILLLTFLLLTLNPDLRFIAILLSAIVTLLLTIFFGFRYVKTRKPMPGLAMVIVGLVMLVILVLDLIGRTSTPTS